MTEAPKTQVRRRVPSVVENSLSVIDREGNQVTTVQVDPDDAKIYASKKWFFDKKLKSVYCIEDGQRLSLHRLVLGCATGNGLRVKFIDGDGLNCRRENLAIMQKGSKTIRFPHKSDKFVSWVKQHAKSEGVTTDVLDVLEAAKWENWARSSEHLTMSFEEGSSELEIAQRLKEAGFWKKFFTDWLGWDKPIAIKSYKITAAKVEKIPEIRSEVKPSLPPLNAKIPMFDLTSGSITIQREWGTVSIHADEGKTIRVDTESGNIRLIASK